MKTLKRISSFVLAFVMALSLCAGFGIAETVKAEESRLIDEVDVKVNPAVVDAYKAKGQLTQEMLDELFIINEENAPYVINPYSTGVFYTDDVSWEGAYEYRLYVEDKFVEGWAYKVQCVLEPKYDSGYDGFSATTTNATEGYVMSPPAASRSTGYYGITVTYYLGEEVSSITLDVDWTQLPKITLGEVPPSPEMDSKAIKLSGDGVETNPEPKIAAVAIKATEAHIEDGYIEEGDYREAQDLYNGWLPSEIYIETGYKINNTDEYAIWTYAPIKHGYRFDEKGGEYVGVFESNVEVVSNFIMETNVMVVFLKLGTLAEIESEKELAESGHTHSFEYIITEEATATEEGVMIGTCSCGKKDEVVVPVTGTSGEVTVESEDTNSYTGKLANQEEIENIVPLTKEEQLSIVNGDDLVISLVVKDIKDTVSATDKTEIEKKLTGKQLGTYLDVKLLKQIGSAQATEVTNTKGMVKIAFVVPEALRNAAGNRTYTILRLHDGVVDPIVPVFDKETNTLTFETDRFSTYALAYEDADTTQNGGDDNNNQKEETNSVPKTGDTTSVMPYIVILGLGCAIVALAGKKREVL